MNSESASNLRIVVIGAGMAGILAGIKLQEMGLDNFCIYEKAGRIGGTWRENTYPGITCDTPSHHYTYTFERNPDWSRHLPPGEEIQNYFQKVTLKYGVEKFIRFNEEIVSANFEEGLWRLRTNKGSEDSAHIVIAATGVLHHPSYPDIPGIDCFSGHSFHSSRWDHSLDLAGKRIAVVGNGSTGVQIVSALSGRAGHIEHYQRTAQWIMPVENGYFSEEERASFRADPSVLSNAMGLEEYEETVNTYTEAITGENPEAASQWADACLQNLEQSVRDADLKEKLRPDHKAMCKRLIFSQDYYGAIQHESAELVTENIECIEPQGIRTSDGKLHELDIIVFATGFRTDQFMRPMKITGTQGLEIEQVWQQRPSAYLAVSMPDFPNFFMLNGPNGPVGNFTLIDIAEKQWDYIAHFINKLQRGECKQISPKQEVLEQFEKDRIEAAKKTIWYTGGCNSWYLDTEGIPSSWPWSYNRFLEEMSEPRWENFSYT